MGALQQGVAQRPFGRISGKQERDRVPQRVARPDTLARRGIEPAVAVLAGEFRGFAKGRRYKLENGQVWEQVWGASAASPAFRSARLTSAATLRHALRSIHAPDTSFVPWPQITEEQRLKAELEHQVELLRQRIAGQRHSRIRR